MKVKQTPEDFVVKEVLELQLEEGPWNYYLITKKNWNTLDLLKEIAKKLKIKVKDIGYAGLKDRNAVTSQYISVKRKINFTIKNVTFEFVGEGKQKIYLGQLKGNEFIITIRDLDKELKPIKEIVNLYGEQRFSQQNAEVGKHLVKKQFKEACQRLNLEVISNDYIGTLRKHGIRKLKFYINAYSSLLWNKLAKKSGKKIIPILGFLTEGDDYKEILKQEGITTKNFIIRSIPEISAEGSERKRIVKVQNFETISYENDDLNPEKKKQTVQFFLEKGAYATTVIQSFISAS